MLHPIDAGGQVEWASVGLQLSLEALHEDVAFPQGQLGQPTSEERKG